MKIVKAKAEIMFPVDGREILKRIERIGRVCYKSEDKITEDSAETFVKSLIKRGHESVLEHCSFTARFVCDRGVSHEIVRHRLASYSQESTRYCNYSKGKFGKEITVVKPNHDIAYDQWEEACCEAEYQYGRLLAEGCTPEQARAVLPNSLKTELIMTANLREWRHFFKLRNAPAAHPQMREVAGMLLAEAKEKIPVIFEDIG